MKVPENRICLMFDKEAEQAAHFYAETFPHSSVGTVHRAPSDSPSSKNVWLVQGQVGNFLANDTSYTHRSDVERWR